jgi:hypothetical protein
VPAYPPAAPFWLPACGTLRRKADILRQFSLTCPRFASLNTRNSNGFQENRHH